MTFVQTIKEYKQKTNIHHAMLLSLRNNEFVLYKSNYEATIVHLYSCPKQCQTTNYRVSCNSTAINNTGHEPAINRVYY